MEVWIFFLSILWCVAWLRGVAEFSPAFLKAKPVFILFVAWLGYLVIQSLPLPPLWVAFLSPERVLSHSLISSENIWLPLTQDSHTTWVYFLKSIAYVQLFSLVLLLANTSNRVRLLAYTIVYSALFQAVYGSIMILSGLEYGFFVKKEYGIGTATGTFVNRNHLAGYLEMALAVGIGLLIAGLRNGKSVCTTRQRLRNSIQLIFSSKFRLRIFLAFMVIALVLTHSRMGNTAFFTSLLVTGVITLLLTRHATRITALLLTSLIVIDLFIVGTWFGIDKVAERLEKTSIATEVRVDVNEYAVDYLQDYLLTGSGAGTFFTVFSKYKGQDASLYFDHAHNDYLEFADETGFLGIALLAGVIFLTALNAVQALRKRSDPLMLGIAFACVMGLISILIHSLVDFNLHIPANAATFMVILAFGFIASTLNLRVEK
ncbi:MAG: O-antigen ligase family protein [Gammaproteobacteria bacterium]|nr:O-antigen ligase family protein [Gammaproteobacteria bacterium]